MRSNTPKRPRKPRPRATRPGPQTYDYLRQFLWIVERDRAQAARSLTGVEYEPNELGLCYIDVSDVENVPPPASPPAPAPAP